MGLVLVNFGGNINTGTSVASPGSVVDEWSCSVAYINDPAHPLTQANANFVSSRVRTWFVDAVTKIHDTVSLETVKVNEFAVTSPWHQITDPTMYGTMSAFLRGYDTVPRYPTTTSYRVSLSDGTRNRRAKGGFYVPRTSMAIDDTGRFAASDTAGAAGTAKTMLNGIATDTGWTLAVWSRAGGAATAVKKLRVGDVPDNVSRRKDDMRETYATLSIP